jgi:hypothetical protein
MKIEQMETSTRPLVGSIRFEDWRNPIQMAGDVDAVVRLARSYYCTWTPEQLEQLPWVVTANPPSTTQTIVACAVVASRAEINFAGTPDQHNLLRDMALTMAATATRLRQLRSFGNRV